MPLPHMIVVTHMYHAHRYTFNPPSGQQPEVQPPMPAFACELGQVARGADGHLWIVRQNERGVNAWVHHARADEPCALYVIGDQQAEQPGSLAAHSDPSDEGTQPAAAVPLAAQQARTQARAPGLSASHFTGHAAHPGASAAAVAAASRTVVYLVRVTPRTVDIYTRSQGPDPATGTPQKQLVHTVVSHVRVLVAASCAGHSALTATAGESSGSTGGQQEGQVPAEGSLEQHHAQLLGSSWHHAAKAGSSQDGVCCAAMLVEFSPGQWMCVRPGSIITFRAVSGEQVHSLQLYEGADGAPTGAASARLVAQGTGHVYHLDSWEYAPLSAPDMRQKLRMAVVHCWGHRKA